ncbi:MAG: methionine biosynthesis protein MetW [Rickettsiales bacterium]|nr:methionine biosynthesis protein MetW [Rickettsiales bacterium]
MANKSTQTHFEAMGDLIQPKSKVLDIGCAEGDLLQWLREHREVDGRGIEIDQSKVNRAIAKGVSVIQGDVNSDLSYYPNQSYDYAILSQTLQAMQDPKGILAELMRIGKQAVVSVPNFGHWRNRLHLGLHGKMPVTKTLTYQWYDTPNIHFCTITDFVELCEAMDIRIDQRIMMTHSGVPTSFSGKGFWANLFGEQGIFLLSKK